MDANVIVLQGRLTKDNDLRQTQATGVYYAKNSIAFDVGFGEKKKTGFMDFTIFGKIAEGFCRNTKKGDSVTITGTFEPNNYTSEDGTKEYRGFVVNCTNISYNTIKKSDEKPKFEQVDGDLPF